CLAGEFGGGVLLRRLDLLGFGRGVGGLRHARVSLAGCGSGGLRGSLWSWSGTPDPRRYGVPLVSDASRSDGEESRHVQVAVVDGALHGRGVRRALVEAEGHLDRHDVAFGRAAGREKVYEVDGG